MILWKESQAPALYLNCCVTLYSLFPFSTSQLPPPSKEGLGLDGLGVLCQGALGDP